MAKLYIIEDLLRYWTALISLVASLRFRYTKKHQKVAFTWTLPEVKTPQPVSKTEFPAGWEAELQLSASIQSTSNIQKLEVLNLISYIVKWLCCWLCDTRREERVHNAATQLLNEEHKQMKIFILWTTSIFTTNYLSWFGNSFFRVRTQLLKIFYLSKIPVF